MFNPDLAVLLVADSWEQLRKSDVYRLFEAHEDSQANAIYGRLRKERPDLKEEALEVMMLLGDMALTDSHGGFEYDASYGL